MWLRHKAQGCAYCLANRICGKAGANAPACFYAFTNSAAQLNRYPAKHDKLAARYAYNQPGSA